MTLRRATLAALLLAVVPFVVGLLACEKPADDDQPTFIDIGDLERIQERGTVRVLLPRRGRFHYLPRHGLPLDFERELAADYAHSMGLRPIWVYVDSRDRLIPDLVEGKGDLVAANLTVTEQRSQDVEFTVPVAVVREQLVVRADDPIDDVEQLIGRRIAIRRSSSFWETLEALRDAHPRIEVEEVDEKLETEEIIHGVATGEYDATIADSNLVDAVMQYRDDIRPALDLTPDRPIAWAVRPDGEQLRESLDRFLTAEQLTDRRDELLTDDLDVIRKRKVLRLLTRNMPATYFLWRGRLMGFEYELVREFAHQEGLRLEVIVPPPGEDLLEWLREGRGDLVSASLTPTDTRREAADFCRPYSYVSQMVVARTDDELHDISDLEGRTFYVRPRSAYRQTLEALRATGVGISIADAPEEMNTEEIIGRVASGEYDLTLADSHIVGIELSWRDDIHEAFPLSESIPLAWAVRHSNPQLRAAADAFVAREYRGLTYNVIHDRYFRDEQRIRRHLEERVATTGGISPYDAIVKRYAEEYGFDWRLIVSVMYQESRFEPTAHSFAGARGLMQILPETGREMGFDDLENPDIGIHAGVKYLDWVRNRFEDSLSVRDRMWFTLAAYNAGPGHVREARRLASGLGLDPNRWFGNVEQAMLLLSRPQYASQSRYGYCRCNEPVNYVRDVRTRYNAYVETLGL